MFFFYLITEILMYEMFVLRSLISVQQKISNEQAGGMFLLAFKSTCPWEYFGADIAWQLTRFAVVCICS